jgi:hypothetical protein
MEKGKDDWTHGKTTGGEGRHQQSSSSAASGQIHREFIAGRQKLVEGVKLAENRQRGEAFPSMAKMVDGRDDKTKGPTAEEKWGQ